jgi:hypothetical protein
MSRRFRFIDGEVREVTSSAIASAIPPPPVSDTLGFPEQCLADREQQRQAFGCNDIEFRRDPSCPEFFQVHGASRKALESYGKRRNFVNRTGSLGGGLILSQEDLDKAAELVGRASA